MAITVQLQVTINPDGSIQLMDTISGSGRRWDSVQGLHDEMAKIGAKISDTFIDLLVFKFGQDLKGNLDVQTVTFDLTAPMTLTVTPTGPQL